MRVIDLIIDRASAIINFLVVSYAALVSVLNINDVQTWDYNLGQLGYIIVGLKVGDYLKDIKYKQTIFERLDRIEKGLREGQY